MLLTNPNVSSRPYSNTLIKHWKRERQNRTQSPGSSRSGLWNSLGKKNVPTVNIIILNITTRPHVSTRGETIWVDAILHIVFECIAIYCHIAILDWILVKRHLYEKVGFGSKEKNIHPV